MQCPTGLGLIAPSRLDKTTRQNLEEHAGLWIDPYQREVKPPPEPEPQILGMPVKVAVPLGIGLFLLLR